MRTLIEGAGLAIDVAGVLVIVVGTVISAILAVTSGGPARGYRGFRQNVGRSILLGLELLVAGDIIRTVALEPTLRSVLLLGLIVVIRTFLSTAIQVELEGKWPWQAADSNSKDRNGRPASVT